MSVMVSFNRSTLGRLNADWWVENMNPDVTSYRMLLDISVLPKINIKKNKTNM